VDVILREAWLVTLGEVKTNWKELQMSFMHYGQNIVTKEDLSLSKTLISAKSLKKIVKSEVGKISVMWGMEQMHIIKQEFTREQWNWLQELLLVFHGGFQEQKGIPPTRDYDHQIPIEVGVDLVNVRPYRYSHVLTNKIEPQVINMLALGIIRPSNSPYSSPIILVKKRRELEVLF